MILYIIIYLIKLKITKILFKYDVYKFLSILIRYTMSDTYLSIVYNKNNCKFH